ncbi:hypothetical protein BMS3Abin10_01556 [bacterium BMS3Abin10]|nr:hypothetical protein BMS3Abin10_01556 [bacterium BMS3Abin10]GBE37613.1 hypothetical protein BMS3Bbin08_00203 [bacterium BMS3Bbin08]
MKLYKYIRSKYLDDFINKGLILFRSLSYFKNYEEDQIRGDRFEGTKKYAPSDGLIINNLTTGKTFKLKSSFESNVKGNDIFIFCMSSKHDQDMYNKFNADICIELTDANEFIKKVAQAVNIIKHTILIHGFVNYYNFNDPPIVDWALPDKIIMSKHEYFKWQSEYRIAFGINSAFKIENVDLFLEKDNTSCKLGNEIHTTHHLELGSLKKITKIYKFNKI